MLRILCNFDICEFLEYSRKQINAKIQFLSFSRIFHASKISAYTVTSTIYCNRAVNWATLIFLDLRIIGQLFITAPLPNTSFLFYFQKSCSQKLSLKNKTGDLVRSCRLIHCNGTAKHSIKTIRSATLTKQSDCRHHALFFVCVLLLYLVVCDTAHLSIMYHHS